MSEAIRIEISDEPTPDIIHRFRNFGEDVFRALCDTCTVNQGEVDAATTSFVVSNIRKQELQSVREVIQRELRHHHFEASAKLVRL